MPIFFEKDFVSYFFFLACVAGFLVARTGLALALTAFLAGLDGFGRVGKRNGDICSSSFLIFRLQSKHKQVINLCQVGL